MLLLLLFLFLHLSTAHSTSLYRQVRSDKSTLVSITKMPLCEIASYRSANVCQQSTRSPQPDRNNGAITWVQCDVEEWKSSLSQPLFWCHTSLRSIGSPTSTASVASLKTPRLLPPCLLLLPASSCFVYEYSISITPAQQRCSSNLVLKPSIMYAHLSLCQLELDSGLAG